MTTTQAATIARRRRLIAAKTNDELAQELAYWDRPRLGADQRRWVAMLNDERDRRRAQGCNWRSTGQWHTEPCGCVHIQQVETGVVDYHERWSLLTKCPRHALATT